MERLLNCKNVRAIGVLHHELFGAMPCFELKEKSREEWSRECRETFRKRCIREHGHEPEDFEAVYSAYQRRLRSETKGMKAYAGNPDF